MFYFLCGLLNAGMWVAGPKPKVFNMKVEQRSPLPNDIHQQAGIFPFRLTFTTNEDRNPLRDYGAAGFAHPIWGTPP